MKITTPATDVAVVQQKATILADSEETTKMLKRPQRSATNPGRTRPKKDAPLTIDTR